MPSIQSLGLEVHSVPEPRRKASKTLKPDLWGIHALYANYNSNKLLFIVNENSMEDTHMICYFVDQWQWFVLEVWSLRPVKWYWSSSLQKKRRYVKRNIYTHTLVFLSFLPGVCKYQWLKNRKINIWPANYEINSCLPAPKFVFCGETFRKDFFWFYIHVLVDSWASPKF